MDSSKSKLCAQGCGFYGSPSTLNLCSKCFRQEQLNAASEKHSIHKVTSVSPLEVPLNPIKKPLPETVQKKCMTCKKRLRITRGFKCRCGFSFCESHRYPEKHMCSFNYKVLGKHQIAKVNPRVKADKLERI